MKTNSTTCDNCKKQMKRGLELSNFGERERDTASIERNLQFCGFVCLCVWATNADAEAPKLEKSARSYDVHGTFANDNVPGLICS